MLFTSTIFLYAFLPTLLALYLVTPRPLKNALLALASLFFYFWGEVSYIWVFALSVLLNYLAGRGLGQVREPHRQRVILLVGLALNLGLLAYFKYANFIVGNCNLVLASLSLPMITLPLVHLPIGISFVTFHAMSYLIDIKRGTSRAQRNPLDTLLYLSLFPQLIAGPIIRYHQIEDQIRSRDVTLTNLYQGIRRFTFGLAKKVLVANPLGVIADAMFAIPGHDITSPLAWLGILAYTLQLYFDFSGYSCMAIGLARMFGFQFPENFNYPYISRSIQEFWRRWHISLSSWFRDYLYIPLGGNRAGVLRTYINLVLVFFLCGLWHGASWNFVVWGLFHGMFLVIERTGVSSWLEQTWRPLAHLYTILVFMIAWVFFRADTLPHALDYIRALAGFGSTTFHGDNAGFYLTRDVLATFGIAILLSTPVWPALDSHLQQLQASHNPCRASIVLLIDGLWILALMAVCILHINEASYNPFIYFRF